MYVCIFVRMYVCMWVCVDVCTCMYVCMHACMDAYTYACSYVCMYVRINVCMHACMYVCMHICTYVCMYACLYAYKCMHVRMFVCICKPKQGESAWCATADQEGVVYLLPLLSSHPGPRGVFLGLPPLCLLLFSFSPIRIYTWIYIGLLPPWLSYTWFFFLYRKILEVLGPFLRCVLCLSGPSPVFDFTSFLFWESG